MRNRTPVIASLLLVLALALSGCGQKGPLVPPKAQLTAAPASLR